MKDEVYTILIALLVFMGCGTDKPEAGVPTVSVSIEAVDEPVREQAAMVEERFVNLLSRHMGDEFLIIKGIGGSTSIHGTIARQHRDTQQLQVDLVVESRGARETIQETYTLDIQEMQQLATLVYDKLTRLNATSTTSRPVVRTRRRPVVVISNQPAMLRVYAGDMTVESKRHPGSNLAVSLSLDGTRGYRFVAAPIDSSTYHPWESVSSNYWPPEDTLIIRF